MSAKSVASSSPRFTKSPVFAAIIIPAAWFISSSFFSLPAPSRTAVKPIFSESMWVIYPSTGAYTSRLKEAFLNFDVSSIYETSPPCNLTIISKRLSASPLLTASSTSLPHSSLSPIPASISILHESSRQTVQRSPDVLPLSISTDSMTSSELPTALPSGESIFVIRAAVLTPAPLPISTIVRASRRESSSVFIKDPLPVLTSRRIQSEPSASFLLMMLEAMSGMLSTVAVTSRRA